MPLQSFANATPLLTLVLYLLCDRSQTHQPDIFIRDCVIELAHMLEPALLSPNPAPVRLLSSITRKLVRCEGRSLRRVSSLWVACAHAFHTASLPSIAMQHLPAGASIKPAPAPGGCRAHKSREGKSVALETAGVHQSVSDGALHLTKGYWLVLFPTIILANYAHLPPLLRSCLVQGAADPFRCEPATAHGRFCCRLQLLGRDAGGHGGKCQAAPWW